MAIPLSDTQRQLLEGLSGEPVQVIDERTQRVYYLIDGEQFEKIRALLSEEEFNPRDAYPLIEKTAAEAGWNNPLMDAYDNYDEHRSKD